MQVRQLNEPDGAGPLHGLPASAPNRAGFDTDCLLEDDVLAFAQGQLSRAQRCRVHAHLDLCTICQRLTSEVLHQLGAQQPSSPGRGWLSNFAVGAMLAERYRILSYLGRGGMGEVYRAHDIRRERDIAIKTLVVTVSDNPRARAQLSLEVQLGRSIIHPNVCRIFGMHRHTLDDGSTQRFFTLQLIIGQSLRRRLRSGPLQIGALARLARSLLSGLSAIHEAGVLHCDLKSDNIMLRARDGSYGQAVITDFGLAQRISPSAGAARERRISGSPPYMAPEQLSGEAPSVRTDLYAIGTVLFEALTGQLPFGQNGSPLRGHARRLAAVPPAPSSLRSAVPRALDDLLLRCLAPHPSDRFPSAQAMLDEFERHLGALEATTEPAVDG